MFLGSITTDLRLHFIVRYRKICQIYLSRVIAKAITQEIVGFMEMNKIHLATII